MARWMGSTRDAYPRGVPSPPRPFDGTSARSVRAGTIEVLELLADLAAQHAYGRNVPTADVPAELACMWFDDVYHPESAVHAEAFTPAEQRVLADFNAFYDRHVRALPMGEDLAILHACPTWIEITQRAGEAVMRLKRAP